MEATGALYRLAYCEVYFLRELRACRHEGRA
jgi:hypothetical protein